MKFYLEEIPQFPPKKLNNFFSRNSKKKLQLQFNNSIFRNWIGIQLFNKNYVRVFIENYDKYL